MLPTKPRHVAPVGSCDTHIHIFEPGFAAAPTAIAPPPQASLSAYLTARTALGFSRSVVVQPTAYGADNACTLAAIAAMGGSARGIAMVDAAVSAAQLRKLNDGGMRGFRMRTFPGGILQLTDLETVAARTAPLGWHVDLEMDGRTLPDHAAMLARLPLPVVVAHIGKFMEPLPTDHPAVQTLLRLLEGGKTYVKLAAPYDSSRSGPPGYADLGPLVRLLFTAAPERLIFASNWPHASLSPDKRPDDAAWLDWVCERAPDAARRRMLVDSPAMLYGFDP